MRYLLAVLITAFFIVGCSTETVEPLPDDETPITEPTPDEGDTGAQPQPPAEDTPTEEEFITGEAIVDDIQVEVLESFPVQLQVTVSGSLNDGCTELGDVMQEFDDGETITITLQTIRPADAVCTQALRPFEETIPVDIEGLPAGTYTVDVNGVQETFTLDADNSAPSPPDDGGDPVDRPEPANTIDFETVTANPDGTLTVQGQLPNGCTGYINHIASVVDNEIQITLTNNVPSDVMCTMAITPYSYTIELDEALTAGQTYTVIINDNVATTFTAEE